MLAGHRRNQRTIQVRMYEICGKHRLYQFPEHRQKQCRVLRVVRSLCEYGQS
jgi:hypothetical protein